MCCPRPDWCVFAGFQYKNGREGVEKERDIAAFEVVLLSKPISAYHAGCIFLHFLMSYSDVFLN